MELYFAPMEGITDGVFRRLHQRFYGGVARYYIPFFSPTQHHRLTPRECRELAPVPGLPAVPQVLTKNAQDFLWASQCAGGPWAMRRSTSISAAPPAP